MEIWVRLQNGTLTWKDYLSVDECSFDTFGYWIEEYKLQ